MNRYTISCHFFSKGDNLVVLDFVVREATTHKGSILEGKNLLPEEIFLFLKVHLH